MKTFRIFLVTLLCVMVFAVFMPNAFAALDSGYLNGPGASYNFSLYGPTDLIFTYPKGSAQFWVKVVGPNGAVSNFNLDNGEVIQLLEGGLYYLTIYSNRGAGYWSVDYYSGGGGGGGGGCNSSGRSAWGYLNRTGDTCSWSIYSNVNNLSVNFAVPGGGTDFWVEVYGRDGNLLNTFDLDQSPAITLSGGGQFYLTIYSNRGAGNWSCNW